MKKIVLLMIIPTLFSGIAFTSCGSDKIEPKEDLNFGIPSAFTNIPSKSETNISYDESHRFSKITFSNLTFTFVYSGANIIACHVVQKVEDDPHYGYALREIEFKYESSNKVIANSFMSNNVPIYSDTIYISDNGLPERINKDVFFIFEQITGNLLKYEKSISGVQVFYEFEYDKNQGLFNNISIEPWLCYYFYTRNTFVFPVFELLLNHTNNVISETIISPRQISTNKYIYTYRENNYPQTVQMRNYDTPYDIRY